MKAVIALVAIVAFALVGCTGKSSDNGASQVAKPAAGMQAGAASTGSPHAGIAPGSENALPGPSHKGKAVSTVNASGYTYIEVEENGNRIWVAVMETKVKAGDTVEFPDIPPLVNFHSNTLNRTFEKIMLSSAVSVNGKLLTAEPEPGKGPTADPHAGLKVQEVGKGMTMPTTSPSGGNPQGAQGAEGRPVHKGKVVSTMDAAGYTYVEVEEKGAKIWAAVKETKVKAGDTVEFPDFLPMKNFRSNTLNRTFETIIFAPSIKINGRS